MIPLQGRKVNAIVKEVHQVEQKKMELKRKDFELKGIEKVISPTPVIPEPQMKLALWLQHYFLSSLGAALRLFVPRSLTERKTPVEEKFNSSGLENSKTETPALLWATHRSNDYQRQLQQVLNRGHQAIFLVPEIADVEPRLNFLKENLSERVVTFHSRLGVSEQFENWKSIRTGQARVVVGTRSAVFTPCSELGLIILDQEQSSSYKSWEQHPRYETKRVAEKLAEITGSRLTLGSKMPSVSSYYHAQRGKYQLNKEQIEFQPEVEISDLKQQEQQGYCLLGEDLTEKLEQRLRQNQKSVLFMNRRGLATSVICQDCGHAVKCNQCDVPMVYHQDGSYLLCHHCGEKENHVEACPNCGGHRLKYFGAGTQKVAQKVREIFPEANVLRLDSDVAENFKQQQQTKEEFEQQGDILVGTRLLLKTKFPENVFTGIVLIDPILSLPEFNAQEQVFQMIAGFRSKSEQMSIQTYNSEHELFGYLNEKPEKFYQKELKNRKKLWYPPYSEIIKLVYSDPRNSKAKQKAQRLKEKIEERFKNLNLKFQVLGPVPNYVPQVKNEYIWNLIIKSEPDSGPLKKELRSLIPKDWKVDVNPIQVL